MNIIIAKPKEEHAEAIADICSTGWKQTVDGKLSEEYQTKNSAFWYNLERVKNDIKQGSYSYVAIHHAKVIGVIGGDITKPHTGEVFMLYMDENYRYKGVGRQLLDALTKKQIEEGATEQWVSVQEDNDRGIPFYEARGFIYRKKKITMTETGEEQVSFRYVRKVEGGESLWK
ncbi:GNAT family N-acetyltransferase [Gracilibacillus sp. S3-1-1]|uniref:GNAT family N-acetyltransferase n=1 Tax=Gracilibacillus pellucidus TaxID=3095368 RepID=A0ACC6M331_9BACI|nr:GNAT family N-acetyltransferase [Gracilibacillus sp. S3-1-1]MDX8045257.1 GNAT family N-acetyltransferase [Gracilibacillus sp. S3-1-1]